MPIKENCSFCNKIVTINIQKLHNGAVCCKKCRATFGVQECVVCENKYTQDFFKYESDAYTYSISDEKFNKDFEELREKGLCVHCANDKAYKYRISNRRCVVCMLYHSTENDACPKCIENLKPCVSCGEKTTRKINVDGEYINLCNDCKTARGILKCSACAGYTKQTDDSSAPEHNVIVCEKCAKKYPARCDFCHSPQKKENLHTVQGMRACVYCIDSMRECPECGEFKKIYTLYDNSKSLDGLKSCEDCHRKEQRGIMHGWDYKPKTIHYNGSDSSCRFLYFGFENETYIKSRSLNIRDKHLGNILSHFPSRLLYSKFDGSIGGNRRHVGDAGEHGTHGFELVSHPMSFQFFKEFPHWDKLFTKQTIKHETCGMHIHINRAAFTPLHLFKFISLVHANDNFINYIAERDVSNNIYTTNISGEAIANDCKRYKKPKGNGHIFRRAKVNLCNDFTIELRFFSNAVNVHQLYKNMEFAHALYSYTKELPQSYAKDIGMFMEWIGYNDNIYPELNSFLIENEFDINAKPIPTPKKNKKIRREEVEGYTNAFIDNMTITTNPTRPAPRWVAVDEVIPDDEFDVGF